jgi:hypothetical protein
LTGSRIKGPFQADIETLLLRSRTVIGQIDRFLDEGVDIDRSMLARSFARCKATVFAWLPATASASSSAPTT